MERPRYPFVQKMRDRFMYPSIDTQKKLQTPSSLGALTVEAAFFATGKPGLIPLGLAIGVPGIVNVLTQRRRRVEVGSFLLFNKVKNPKEKIIDGDCVKEGEMIGELHAKSYNKKGAIVTSSSTPRTYFVGLLNSLIDLGELTANNDEAVRDIRAFYGTSHLIRPRIFEGLFNFHIEESCDSRLDRGLVRLQRSRTQGVRSIKKPVGKVRTMWFTQPQLIAALPEITKLRDRLVA